MIRIRPFARALAAATTSLALAAGALLVASAPARADAPPSAWSEFAAPECPGETDNEPTEAPGPVPDLTRVFGARLADFNAGRVVALYSNFGDNDFGNPVPPTCGTRFVDGQAVSEWMYCTDLWSHTCSGTDEDGRLVDHDGVPVPGMGRLPGANPKLSADQEKLIAYLIRNGHTYRHGGGGMFSDVTFADPAGTSAERGALQVLVWCISDEGGDGWPAVAAACAATMPPTRQAELLALIPDDPEMHLDLVSPAAPLAVGDTATLTLTTNIFGRPISFAAEGVEGELAVLSGPAALAAGALVVSGDDPEVPVVVELGFTAATSGRADFEVSVRPDTVRSIGWHQSPGVAADEVGCQVYAVFHEQDLATVSAAASAEFAAGDGPPVTPAVTGDVLPPTGADPTPTALAAGGGMLLGLALLGVRRRRRALVDPAG